MKFFKLLYLYIFGYVDIKISGFFTERFVNLCFAKSIFLWKLNRNGSCEISARISKSDFSKLRAIAKNSKCKVEILRKRGAPFVLNKYKKRKTFAITFGVIAILIFSLTRFVWNIDINCDGEINKTQIMNILNENGIKEGKLISKIDTNKTINEICLKGENVSWCGIKIMGTNVIVSLEKATPQNEIIDESKICDIVANKSGIITKVIARNGTAVVKAGDKVNKGDILISNIIEGKYTEVRNVHALGDVFAKMTVNSSLSGNFREEFYENSNKKYENFRIKFNNFEINFNKTLPKFEKYDTIVSNKKIKLFSNFYLPIEFKKITYKEKNLKYKNYSKEELSNKLQKELKDNLLESNNIKEENITDIIPNETITSSGIKLDLTIVYEENIGITKEVN